MNKGIAFPLHKDDYSDIIDSNGVLVYSLAMNPSLSVLDAEATRNWVYEALNLHESFCELEKVAKQIRMYGLVATTAQDLIRALDKINSIRSQK